MMPYWVDSAPEIPSYADRPLPERTDVLVGGGGYTGLSTALHLARKGAEVIAVGQIMIQPEQRQAASWRLGVPVRKGFHLFSRALKRRSAAAAGCGRFETQANRLKNDCY